MSTDNKKSEFSCPRCSERFYEKTVSFPFCSKRCQLIDLGAWATGAYAIAAVDNDEDPEQQSSVVDEDLNE